MSDFQPPSDDLARPPQRRPINPELFEHRLNELQKMAEENRKEVSEINTAMVAVRMSLTTVETHMKHTPTKAWVLAGVIGGIATATTIVGIIFKYWPS